MGPKSCTGPPELSSIRTRSPALAVLRVRPQIYSLIMYRSLVFTENPYGLKQAPRAWYDRLKNFLLAQGFKMGCVDKTLFLMRSGSDFLLVQIYVYDIIFGGSTHALVSKFSEQMFW